MAVQMPRSIVTAFILTIVLCLQQLRSGNGLNVTRRPEDQIIFRGQNAFFHCLLNGTDGELIPVQWSISEDGPSENITMNSTEYLILPPANSILVLVRPTFDLFVTCTAGTEEYNADLGVNRLPNCNVDNGNCEDSCIESNCLCSNNQTLIRTSCVSQPTYFTIFDEVYEDSDIFIHHPLYHLGPFQIICNSGTIDVQGQWIVQAFNSNTTIAFNNTNGTILNNSSINALVSTSRGSSILRLDQPIEGYFTCVVNNVSHTIEVLTGGKPLLELLTPEPIYISSLFYEIVVRAFIVNSFGKTVRASQSQLAVTFANGTDRIDSRIRSYISLTGRLASELPLPRNIDLRTELGSSDNTDIFVEISLISAANFTTNISFSPVYAELVNISSISGQSIFAAGQFSLNCFTIPNDLPVVWTAFNFDYSYKELTGDPRAIVQSTGYGSRLTLMNTTVEDSGYYACNSIQGTIGPTDSFSVTVIPDTISIVIEYGDFLTLVQERPSERDYPLDGSLYIIQESVDFPLNQFEILCYNLESNNATDTEIMFANPNITSQNFDHVENNFAALNLGSYPTSFNGNVTCRSQATGKASTVYIANATESGAFVIPVTQSPVTILPGDNATFTYRIGLTNDTLDVASVINVIPVDDVDIDEPVLVYLGNSFYDVQFTSVCCSFEFYLAFNRVRVSPRANIRIPVLVPVTTINGSEPNVLVGQKVELFCNISLPGITTIPNDINYTVNWFHDSIIVFQSAAIGSLVHTFTIEDVNSNHSGRYMCSTDLSEPVDSFTLLVLTNPVSVGAPILIPDFGRIPSGPPLIIPDGNVFNSLVYNFQERIPRFKRGGESFFPLTLDCYTTRGHENPVWEFPQNSSFYSNVSMISPYQTALILNVPLPSESINSFNVEQFVCTSLDNISSSVIVTNNPSFIQPLSPNPVMVKYFQNVTLSFQAAVDSNGVTNRVPQIFLEQPGNSEQVHVFNEANNSQVFAYELVLAGNHTAGNYTASIMFEGFMGNATVEVIVEIPSLVATRTIIHALLGENVTVDCIPSDSNLELQWVISTTNNDTEMIPPMIVEDIVPAEGPSEGSGSESEDGGSKFDDEGSAEMGIPLSMLQSRLRYQQPIHQLTLINALLTDKGYFMCQIKPSPDDDINISQRIALNIFTNVINIGYSPESLIPENNVINLMAIEEKRYISCFTTQSYDNPVWMISSDNFSTGVLPNNGTMVKSFGGINFTITIVKISLYQSDISIDTNGIEFTGNLTCLSQSNSQAQYSVIITTNDFYVQLLSPNPIMAEYLQPLSLTFLAARLSDGISNLINTYPVRSPTGQLLTAITLENSSQIFVLYLGYANSDTVGNYTIPFQGNNIIVEVILRLPTITTISPSIGVLNGENVTIACIPSDPDIEMFWVYETADGSRDSVTVANVSVTRFLSDSPLLHRLVLPNATYSDAGTYQCVAQGLIGSVVRKLTRLNVLPNVVNIGGSPNLLIPDSNVINLPSEGSRYQITLSCYTTQGYENPVWMISSNGFLSRTLKERETVLPGVNVSIIRSSLYLSVIDVEINDTEFTGNLICQPQNNTNFKYTVVITTSMFYVQLLTPISITVLYSQYVNLTFRVAANSNGTVNSFERLPVFQYDSDGSSVGTKLAERLEGSAQVYVLDLDQAGISTSGSYLIFFFDGIRQANATIGIIDVVQVPTLTADPVRNEFLSGETITLGCMPSASDIELYWTYDTDSGRGNITTDTLSRSPFLSNSSLLHQLILPIANVNDAGNYSCVIRRPRGEISQTISFTVIPACGGLDRLSHGVLWPITRIGETVEMFCSEVNPSFGFGPYARRPCRDDETWSRVDTSQCNIRPMQESAIVLSSIYVEVESINATNITDLYEMELRRLYNDSLLIFTTKILSDRLYAPTFADSDIKRQISTRYSLLSPVVFTVNIMSREILTNNVTETIRSIVTQTVGDIETLPVISEIVGFNPVNVCECVLNSGGLQQSPVRDVCIGASGSPCNCSISSCGCNEGYSGNGSLCARDTDRDSFPDVNITCDLSTCLADKCPLIATGDGQDESSCRPLPNTTVHCPQGLDVEYGIMWPPTLADEIANNSCPNGSGTAMRLCSSNGEWVAPNVSRCTSYAYGVLMALMEQVESGSVDLGHLTSNLAMVSNRTDDRTSAYPADLMNANMLLNFSLNAIEENRDILASDETLAQDITDCFSNILSSNNNAGWMELEETNPGQSQMLLMNSERFGVLLAESLEVGGTRTVISDNIVIVAESVDSNNINNVTFSDPGSTSNSIFIPASFIQQRSTMTGTNPIPIVNIVYENIENILPIEINQPISQVLSSQVTDTSVTSSDIAVELTLQYSNVDNDSMPVCGYWNFSLNEGRGGWDTEGVTVMSSDPINSIIRCNSTHLTSFAVLVDVSGGQDDFSDPERRALSIVSYIGCGISIICLLITIIILVYYRNTLFKGIHNFIHLNLAIALILALIVFVSGIEAANDNEVGCTIVAALLHYFFTAVFTWMLCEGIMLYFLLVKVFNTGLGQRRLFYFALGWGIPVPIVAISVGVAHDQYGHEYCWIDYDEGVIWAFVGPMLAIIILNVIFLLLALRSLYKSKRGKLTVEEASRTAIVRDILKATVILLPLLGITWVFGLLAVNQESSAFAWIFTILNTLQGLFILIFHVLRNEKIWQKILSCWKDDKYSFIPSSQRSSTASRSAKIKKSIQTTSTTNSSSTLELKSKLDTSNFHESSGLENESKSFGIEASVVETDDEKPAITDADVMKDADLEIKQDADVDTKQEVAIDMKQEEEAVTTTTFSMDITVPSSNSETDL